MDTSIATRPLGAQSDPMLPPPSEKTKEQASSEVTVKVWEGRFKNSQAFLDAYFERDQQAFEFWYMWREFRGPYRSNIFPPDVHAGVESIVPRLTKGRPKPIVKPRPGQDPEALIRIQRGHDAYWDRMGMDEKIEVVTKRGTWFGIGVEKVTPKVEGHDEPVMQDIPAIDPTTGQPTGQPTQQPVMNDDGTPKTRFVVDYAGPAVEMIDGARFFFPRGYASDAELPWEIFQYFKRKSELDTTIYDETLVASLTAAPNTSDDPTLERDKVHRLPRKSQVQGLAGTEDNIGKSTSDLATDDDKEDPIVELLECWERPTKKYPKGRLVTIANRKTVLRDVDNTLPGGELPSNGFRYIEDTFNYRGIGIARQLERLVLERADKRNQRMDNVSRAIDGMFKVSNASKLEDADLQHRPNGVIRVDEMGELERLDVPDVTPTAYQEDNAILQDEAKATGANEYVTGGGKPTGKTLGEADMMSSSSNERYDGVIRRLERFLNRHAFLVTLIVQQTVEDAQHMDWTDPNGQAQSMEIDPKDWMAIKPEQVVYDAKSVIAYKEVSRQQGMQLLELVDKLLAGDPAKIPALKPILSPLLELFDEIKVSATDLITGIEAYAKQKLQASLYSMPASPDKVLTAVANLAKDMPGSISFDQLQEALKMNGITPATPPIPITPSVVPGGPVAPVDNSPAAVAPVTDTTPDPSQMIAHATTIPSQPHP